MSAHIPYESLNKVLLLIEGDEAAFEELYEQYKSRIYYVALRYLKSREAAEEAVQDVFFKLWHYRQQIRPDHPVEGWLYVVAKNAILNRLKKVSNDWSLYRNITEAEVTSPNSTDDKLVDWEYSKLLRAAIDKLPEQQRNVFVLARTEQLTYKEIGERLNISPLTVKTHMSRALDSIRLFFSDYGIVFTFTILPFL